MTDESRSPLERDVSPDETCQNKPVPFWQVWTVILSDISLNFGSMRQNLDGSITPHMLKRFTCGFIIEKPRCARQVQNLPHTSESTADFPMTDEGGSPLERDVSADKTDQNKPVPFWQGTLPQRARRIPGPGVRQRAQEGIPFV